MNRKALILYIRDLRDLEIAARRIEKLYQEEKKDYEQVLDSLENGKFMSEIEEPIFGVLMGCGVCFLMGYFCNWLKKLVALQLWNYCFFGVAIFFWFMGIVFLFAVISGVLENSRKRDEAQKNNAREEKRIADNQELINQVKSNWKKKETYIQSEYRKVYELKKNYYDQNILAKPYRNLPALIYIYDYISTSSASLSETLLHEHIDYGIKKIVERLDYIIKQNQAIIFNQHRQEARNQTMIDQNQKMLSTLRRTEANTEQTAQYEKLSANYSRTCAYFSMANYLEKNF